MVEPTAPPTAPAPAPTTAPGGPATRKPPAPPRPAPARTAQPPIATVATIANTNFMGVSPEEDYRPQPLTVGESRLQHPAAKLEAGEKSTEHLLPAGRARPCHTVFYRDSGLSDKRGPVRRIVVELIDKLGKVSVVFHLKDEAAAPTIIDLRRGSSSWSALCQFEK